MFEKRTVIIVGAGASAECGLPVGSQLKQHVAHLLDIRFSELSRQESGDSVICNALRAAVGRNESINPHLHAAWRIRDAMPLAISIDNFIDVHQGDVRLELCGKLGIARAILNAERHSRLHVEPHSQKAMPNFGALVDTWFAAFLQLLTENCTINQLEDRLASIALIVFNYDRCIEQLLYYALQNYYGIEPTRAASLLTRLTIYHPYGAVGALPWQTFSPVIEFGAEPNASQLLTLAGQIRTFTEGTDPRSSHIVTLRQRIVDAQIVIFLGFAYHKINLDLLHTQGVLHLEPKKVRYYGTAREISDNDCNIISSELANLAGAPTSNITLRNGLTCSQLLREYWRSFSLASNVRK